MPDYDGKRSTIVDLLSARSPQQASGMLSDLLSGPKYRLRGLLADPAGWMNSAVREAFGADQHEKALSWEQNKLDAVTGSSDTRASVEDAMTQAAMNTALAAMTVYHGSPHMFNKFDMNKIGTGEGAQAYGHGLYLAEAPNTAKTYANAPTGKLQHKITGEVLDSRNIPINKMTEYGATTPNLYKVDLPDEAIAKMLDWDKTLSQQSPEVIDALRAVVKPGWVNIGGGRVWLDPFSRDKVGKAFLDDLRALGHGAPEEILKKAGIPGIRYLDEGSRSAGKGTSNFVVFDDQLPTILERNGKVIGE